MTENDIAAEVIRDFNQLASERSNWETHWREIAERVLPMHSNSFTMLGSQTQGDKRNDYIFDSTAAVALNRFAAILDSLLTPRNQMWHRLTVSDKNLAKDRKVKLFFDEANDVLFRYRYSPKANFASQNQQNYKGLGAYGTSCLFIDELASEPGLRYRDIHLGQVYLAENHQGVIDKAYRYFDLTARQAVKFFGDKLPDRIKEQVKINGETKYYFIHCVKPREDRDPKRVDYKGMRYVAYYVSVEGAAFLKEEGFSTFPYAPSRYEQAPGETYGRGPAMDVLPAIKTLNEQKKTVLKQGHRTVDPVLLAHDDGVADSFSMKPGAINYGGVSADGRALVQALPVGNISIGKDLMDDERAIINDAFLVTLFQILVESPQMTATEVMERTREKGILLAPTIGRQQDERLGPMIERELDVLSRQRLLPPMPEILLEAGADYRIVYDSPLSKAQRAEEASGLMRTIEMALQVLNVTQNPEPLDHFNWDAIIPEISDIQGVPARWMKDPRMVEQIRAQRAQAAQNQEMVNAAPGAAALISSTAKYQKANAGQ